MFLALQQNYLHKYKIRHMVQPMLNILSRLNRKMPPTFQMWQTKAMDETRNWFRQQRIKMIPTVDTWTEMRFVEIEHPDGFFSVGYTPYHFREPGKTYPEPEVQGVICPIPKELLPDGPTLTQYYNVIQNSWDLQKAHSMQGDTAYRLVFDRASFDVSQGIVPDGLRPIEELLAYAYETSCGWARNITYQINSNYHRVPQEHGATGVASIDGATTIMFRKNAEGKITGKKSLPPNSIAIFLGCHAAPDSSAPRLNILVE